MADIGIRHTVVYGGVSQRGQENALRRSPDVLVATPGRLLDLMQQRIVDLSAIEIFVLDEADRMLDMGFVHDVKRIVQVLPKARQTLFFSATMLRSIGELRGEHSARLRACRWRPRAPSSKRISQSVYFVGKGEKRALLERLLRGPDVVRALVFTRTKHGANRVAEQLEDAGIGAAAIHGNKSQGQRDRALLGFRQGTTLVLVATDIAARHRRRWRLARGQLRSAGRSGELRPSHRAGPRAGASGHALSFCEGAERGLLRDIERLIRKPLAEAGGDPSRGEVDPAPGQGQYGGGGQRRYRGVRMGRG